MKQVIVQGPVRLCVSVCVHVVTGKLQSEIAVTWYKYVTWCFLAVISGRFSKYLILTCDLDSCFCFFAGGASKDIWLNLGFVTSN